MSENTQPPAVNETQVTPPEAQSQPQVTKSEVKPDGHSVKATFNEVKPEKMAALEAASRQPGGPKIEIISPTQVTIECHSTEEAEVRAFMAN